MNLKKQISRLLRLEILTNFHLAGAAWVLLLTGRGFTLAQVGLAEAVFHLVSLCGEIPSGMLADLLGRRRTLAAGRVCAVLSALAMIVSAGTGGIYLAMGLSALSYNLASGTREALTYDSLLQAGEERRYLDVSARQNLWYRLAGAGALLCAGLVAVMGHRLAYGLDILVHLAALGTCLSLTEPVVTDGQRERERHTLRDLSGRLVRHGAEVLDFLRGHPRALGLMLVNALVGAGATLLGFFLQDWLTAAGPLMGPLLLLGMCGGAVGAGLVPRLGQLPYPLVACLGAGVVCAGIALAVTGWLPLIAAGGFLAAAGDEVFQIFTDAKLNSGLPSDQRATLISVSSMVFSLVMIVISPVAGVLATCFSW